MPQYKLLGKYPLNARDKSTSYIGLRRDVGDPAFRQGAVVVIDRTNGQQWSGRVVGTATTNPLDCVAEVTIIRGGQPVNVMPRLVDEDKISITIDGGPPSDPQPTPPPYSDDDIPKPVPLPVKP